MTHRILLIGVLLAAVTLQASAQWRTFEGPRNGTVKILCMLQDGRRVLCGSETDGLWELDPATLQWALVGRGFPTAGTSVVAIAVTSEGIVAGTSDELYVLPRGSDSWRIGTDWDARWETDDLTVLSRRILIAVSNGYGLVRAQAATGPWELLPEDRAMTTQIYGIESMGTRLFAASATGLYASDDGGERWERLKVDGRYVAAHSIARAGDSVLLAQFGPSDVESSTLMRSTDAGRTWEASILDLDRRTSKWLIAHRDETIMMAAEDRSIYRSMNGGEHFEGIAAGLRPGLFDDADPTAVCIAGDRVFMAFRNGELWWRNTNELIVGVSEQAPLQQKVQIIRRIHSIDVIAPAESGAQAADLYDVSGRFLRTEPLRPGCTTIAADPWLLIHVR